MLVGHSSSFEKCLFRSLFVCVCGVYLCVCVCGVYIPLCVCVCTHVCPCPHACVHTQRSKSGVFLSSSPCILRQGPLLNPYLASLASLTGQQFPGSSCLLPALRLQVQVAAPGFYMTRGSELRSSWLHGNYFTY